MSDTQLHTDNDPFIDDDYTYSTPALPAYADVLAALGNPADPLAAIAALQKDAAKKELYQQTVTDVMRLHMELFPDVAYIGGTGALRNLILELQAENQLYRKLLQGVLADDDIAYSEIEYALEGERPGEDIVNALADVKAERDSLRDQLHERMEDIAMRVDNALRPVYQAAGLDPQMSEPGDIIRRIQELEAEIDGLYANNREQKQRADEYDAHWTALKRCCERLIASSRDDSTLYKRVLVQHVEQIRGELDTRTGSTELQAQAEVGALLARIPLSYGVRTTTIGRAGAMARIWDTDKADWTGTGATRAEALAAAVAAMEGV